MGFIAPAPPPFDVEEWKRKPHLERIKPLAQEWAVNGFGTPYAIYVLYVVKLLIYSFGGLYLIGHTTPGLGGLGDIGDWWTQPIVFEKVVAWTMLWEIVGMGSGSMALTFRFIPPIGGILYWLRPGTIRLPPFPDKVPGTAGSTRTPLDCLLYALVLGALGYLVFSDGERIAGVALRLEPAAIAITLALLVLLGLRDKVAFLSARPEIYGSILIVGMFGLTNSIIAWQLVIVCIWWGAASSKLNFHFGNVVAVMVSNTPWNRSRTIKKRLYRDWPEDLRPSREATYFAHFGTVMEYSLPLLLLISNGGTLGTIAVAGMVIFHVHILSTFPLAVPLEWNLVMIFATLFLFGHYGEVPYSTLDNPLLIALLVCLFALPVIGNMRPDKMSFLPAMRYYAGNWATTQWCFSKAAHAEETFDKKIVKSAPVVHKQLTRLYDEDMADIFLTKALAFRALHAHGRALNGLLPRAVVGDLEDYTVREGEFLAGATIGWNFGDGHFHGKQLLEAVQERCHFGPGEVRVVVLESQPIQTQRQAYKIYDAATGLVEAGFVEVKDMLEPQPWLAPGYELPVQVTEGGPAAAGSGSTPASPLATPA